MPTPHFKYQLFQTSRFELTLPTITEKFNRHLPNHNTAKLKIQTQIASQVDFKYSPDEFSYLATLQMEADPSMSIVSEPVVGRPKSLTQHLQAAKPV